MSSELYYVSILKLIDTSIKPYYLLRMIVFIFYFYFQFFFICDLISIIKSMIVR